MIFETDSVYSVDPLSGRVVLGSGDIQPQGLTAESTIADVNRLIKVEGVQSNNIIFYASAADSSAVANIGYVMTEYSGQTKGIAVPSELVEAYPYDFPMEHFAKNIFLAHPDELPQFGIDALIKHVRRRYQGLL